jgi:GntR family transcriptional repressor for pyruvate dehydrogenase complex
VPITPVRTTKLYLLIVEQLKQLIQRGEFRPGDRLPTERELAQRLGVSRAPTREALVALELLDVVEGKVGEGWFVKRPPEASLDVNADQDRPPSDILRARLLVECATIEQAARQHDAADVAALATAVEGFQVSSRGDSTAASPTAPFT